MGNILHSKMMNAMVEKDIVIIIIKIKHKLK